MKQEILIAEGGVLAVVILPYCEENWLCGFAVLLLFAYIKEIEG